MKSLNSICKYKPDVKHKDHKAGHHQRHLLQQGIIYERKQQHQQQPLRVDGALPADSEPNVPPIGAGNSVQNAAGDVLAEAKLFHAVGGRTGQRLTPIGIEPAHHDRGQEEREHAAAEEGAEGEPAQGQELWGQEKHDKEGQNEHADYGDHNVLPVL